MLIYCAKCEAANSDQATVCSECGHPLTTLAPTIPTVESTRARPGGTGALVPGSAARLKWWTPVLRQITLIFYAFIHVLIVMWAVGLCILGCVPVMNGAQPHLAPYLPAGLMVLLFYAFRDYYHRWEKQAKRQRRE